jgi:transketolase
MENGSRSISITDEISDLDETSLRLRRLVLRALAAADKGHVGSALSLIEIFRVLYCDVVRHDPSKPTWPERDRVILSKGHGCLALYAVLADQGYFPVETLETFCARHSPLGGHPERQLNLGIEASTGALGHGMPFAVGIALAHRRLRTGVRVFVIVGDGELNEGSNWEAMLLASKHQLDNLTIIVDHNSQQLHGPLEMVLPIAPLRPKLEAFGLHVLETDGHSPAQLLEAFNQAPPHAASRPRALICRTIKGKGWNDAEQNPMWHYKRTFGEELIKRISERWAHRPDPQSDRRQDAGPAEHSK